MTGPDVPEKDRLAEAVVWGLCEGAGASDGAAAIVKPISRDVPVGNLSHEDLLGEEPDCIGKVPTSFDDLVGSGEQSRLDNKPERSGGLQVDDELKLVRPQDRQIGRPLALKNAPAIDADLADEVRKVRSVAHQSPSLDALTIGVDRWQPMVRRQRDEVYATAIEERIVIDQECVSLLSPEACKDHINLAIGARGKDFNLPQWT